MNSPAKQKLRTMVNMHNIFKIMKLFKKLIWEGGYLCLATTLILLLFYIRLLPRVARDLWQNLNHYQFLSLTLNLILVAVHIYLCLKILNIIPTKPKPWLEKLTAKFHSLRDNFFWLFINLYKFVWFMLESFAIKVFNYEGLHYNCLRIFAKILTKKKFFNIVAISLLLLSLLPKIVFTIAFVYDVAYCRFFDYTFKCLPFLLISLLEPILVFVFFDFYDTYWQDINAFVRKIQSSKSTKVTYCFIPEFSVTPPNFVKDFKDFFFNHFVVLANTQKFLDAYKNWKYNKSPYIYISLILCILRFLILVFLLLYGLL